MKHVDMDECPCVPIHIPVEREDGSIGWVSAHREDDLVPQDQAARAIRIFEAMEMVRIQHDVE